MFKRIIIMGFDGREKQMRELMRCVSKKQLEVLLLLIQGDTQVEAAKKLEISPEAVQERLRRFRQENPEMAAGFDRTIKQIRRDKHKIKHPKLYLAGDMDNINPEDIREKW
jgi:esterase/lipase